MQSAARDPGRLYLIRHGTTASNAVRYGGWEDEPLDEHGAEQAKALVSRMAGITLHGIYASPLSRACHTALPIARCRGLDVAIREPLKEINYGRYQGMAKDVHPLNIRHAHVYEPMPDGESLSDVAARIDGFLPELEEQLLKGQNAAIVGHFWSNRILLGRLLRMPLKGMISQLDYKPKNASVLAVSLKVTDGGISVGRYRLLETSAGDAAA